MAENREHLLKGRTLVGVDLGATNVRSGLIRDGRLVRSAAERIPAQGSVDAVLASVYRVIDQVGPEAAASIGVGVPSVVDVAQGVVYEVQNIPAWQEVPVKALLEARYGVPAFVNNDANTFALGEAFFGAGRAAGSLVGLILGTGFAGGVVLGGKLYAGANCGAGEFGMMPYRDSHYEDYCSGQFFIRQGRDGGQLFERARQGDAEALRLFGEFGYHLGQAVKAVLYAYDPELIVFGGSVRKAYPFFSAALHEVLRTFVYTRSLERLQLRLSEDDHIALLGAAVLVLAA